MSLFPRARPRSSRTPRQPKVQEIPQDFHVFTERDDTPGVCTCNRIKANGAHVPAGDPRLVVEDVEPDDRQATHRGRYEPGDGA